MHKCLLGLYCVYINTPDHLLKGKENLTSLQAKCSSAIQVYFNIMATIFISDNESESESETDNHHVIDDPKDFPLNTRLMSYSVTNHLLRA